jgi:hypothetical protein
LIYKGLFPSTPRLKHTTDTLMEALTSLWHPLRVQLASVTLPGAGRACVPAPVPTPDTPAPAPLPGDAFVFDIVAPVRPSVARNLSLARPSALARSLGTCPRESRESNETEVDRHNTQRPYSISRGTDRASLSVSPSLVLLHQAGCGVSALDWPSPALRIWSRQCLCATQL